MYKSGNYEKTAEEILANVIRIICDEENREIGSGERFNSHCEAHGFAVRNYLWKEKAITVEKDVIEEQMTLEM